MVNEIKASGLYIVETTLNKDAEKNVLGIEFSNSKEDPVAYLYYVDSL